MGTKGKCPEKVHPPAGKGCDKCRGGNAKDGLVGKSKKGRRQLDSGVALVTSEPPKRGLCNLCKFLANFDII